MPASIQLRLLLTATLSMVSVSCVDHSSQGLVTSDPLDIVICQQPRPQICTREYNPVCATLKDGSLRTGATGCSACADPDVVSYTRGAC